MRIPDFDASLLSLFSSLGNNLLGSKSRQSLVFGSAILRTNTSQGNPEDGMTFQIGKLIRPTCVRRPSSQFCPNSPLVLIVQGHEPLALCAYTSNKLVGLVLGCMPSTERQETPQLRLGLDELRVTHHIDNYSHFMEFPVVLLMIHTGTLF